MKFQNIKSVNVSNLSFIFMIIFLFCPRLQAGETKITTHAPSAIVIDSKYGVVLFEKDSDRKLYPASITKIMTAYLAITFGELDRKITVSKKAANGIEPGSSSIALKPNEIVTLRDVIFGLMLRSANECGNIIAETISGSNDQFVELMNQTAVQFGCQNTHFFNPHGLPHSDHLTTARDMAQISRESFKLPFFREVVGTHYYPFPDTNIHKHVDRGNLKNKNQMLHKRHPVFYSKCNGIKGGFTKKSLHTFVGSAKEEEREVIAVVMNVSNKKQMYMDLKKLMQWGLSQFELKTLAEKEDLIKVISIPKGNKKLNIHPRNKVKLLLPKPIPLHEIQKEIVLKDLELPIRKGKEVGSLKFLFRKELVGSCPLVSGNDVVPIFSWDNLKKYLISLPFLSGITVLFCLVTFFILRRIEKKSNRN